MSELLGGTDGPAVVTATAGCAAAFLGTAVYFQTAFTRDTDRHPVTAGSIEEVIAFAWYEAGIGGGVQRNQQRVGPACFGRTLRVEGDRR